MKTQSNIFRPKKYKSIGLLILCLLFVFLGYNMLEEKTLIGWLSIVFFGLGAVVFAIQLIPSATYLKLSEEGFETRNLFRSDFTRWNEVKVFKTGYVGSNKMVMLDYKETHSKYKTGKKLAKSLSGSEGALPNTYGMSVSKLVDLLNEWRLKEH